MHAASAESDDKLRIVAEPGEKTIVLTRSFAAPRRLVYRAYTTPELVARWYGPRGTRLTGCEMDFRPGGKWRFVMRGPGDREAAFHGEYREIVPEEKIVATWCFEGYPDAVSVETVVFTDLGERTLVTTTVLHSSVENRDGHLQSGMERGAGETLDRLAEVIRELL